MARRRSCNRQAKGSKGEKTPMKASRQLAGGVGGHAPRRRHANRDTFPLKMFRLLESHQHTGAICWIRGGTTIAIKDKDQLEKILPAYFGHCRIRSLQRQFSFWGFRRIGGTVGDKQAEEEWYHPKFIQGNLESVRSILRSNLKPIPSKMPQKIEDTNHHGMSHEKDNSFSSGITTREHVVKMDHGTHDLTGPTCLNGPKPRITRRVSNTSTDDRDQHILVVEEQPQCELDLGSLSDEESQSFLESFPSLTQACQDHHGDNRLHQDNSTTTAFPSNFSLGGDQRACAMTLHVFDLRLMDDTSTSRSQHAVVANANESDYSMNDPIHHFTELSSSSFPTTTTTHDEQQVAANCIETLDRCYTHNDGFITVGQDDDDVSLDLDMIESVFV